MSEPSAAWRADLARGLRVIAKHASGTVSLCGELLSFEALLNIAAREIEPAALSSETPASGSEAEGDEGNPATDEPHDL